MTRAREDAIKALQDANLQSLTIVSEMQNEVHIYSESCSETVHARARRAMDKGKMVVWADGSRQWIDFGPEMDLSKSGSEMYTWHADGNRIRWTRKLRTVNPDGTEFTQDLPPVWRVF